MRKGGEAGMDGHRSTKLHMSYSGMASKVNIV